MIRSLRTLALACALFGTMVLPAAAQQSGSAASSPAAAAEESAQATLEALSREMKELSAKTADMVEKMAQGQSPVVLTTDQIAAIAIGAIGGAFVVDLLGGGGLATMAGAVVGGWAGNYLYTMPLTGSAAVE